MFKRVVWALLWLGSASFLIYYVRNQWIYLNSNPTSTSVSYDYTNPFAFPTVTICLRYDFDAYSIERFLTNDNSSMGVKCDFGLSYVKSTKNEVSDCRKDATVEYVDWPFGVSSSVCMSFNPGTTTANRTAASRGTVMTIQGSGFHSDDDLRFMVQSKNSSYYPLQGQRIEIGSVVTATFSKTSITRIKNCNTNSSYDQLECYENFEKNCIQQACGCKYISLESIRNSNIGQGAETCQEMFWLDSLYNTSCFAAKNLPCTSAPDAPRTCQLEDVCGDKKVQELCPDLSCSWEDWPTSTSVVTAAAADPVHGFSLELILDDLVVENVSEGQSYTTFNFAGDLAGMIGVTLGFGALTVMELVDGFLMVTFNEKGLRPSHRYRNQIWPSASDTARVSLSCMADAPEETQKVESENAHREELNAELGDSQRDAMLPQSTTQACDVAVDVGSTENGTCCACEGKERTSKTLHVPVLQRTSPRRILARRSRFVVMFFLGFGQMLSSLESTIVVGRKRLHILCVLEFMLSSALATLSVSVPMLIDERALQGIGGGGIIGLTMAIIGEIVSPRERGKGARDSAEVVRD
ncbi:hypothetical protein M427DRAFT_39900 [Gonapodya prolifera JEL478]|uniref:Uncharacterized protein n=1 Tax=Gonapodya prolifera (strain JEL478) TaxID=1344416 RepID=A0A138ZWG9_GONPJ|nr:hypothetical protein M427DRAFT_39900 [Gonapodya prolifera JEL478]|eukprot:KXS08836.1 hypothetical protein M427DRAFT_39900 [Gonapodya prolifera JEL478]